MPPKVMIVGAGFGQLPALRAARAMGIETVAIDRDAAAPGLAIATHPEVVDIVDVDAAVEVARRHGVAGALTLQSDIGVPTVGAIVDALGLPGSGRAVADRCSHKVLLRRCLAEAGVPQPDFRVVRDADEARAAAEALGFPCVVKAADSSGSRGVVRVDRPEDIPAAWAEARRWARSPELLVEAFVDGLEVGAQSFSLEGRCIAVAVHNDTMSPPPYMIPVGHSFPAALAPDIREGIERAVAACVDALGIVAGPANIDLILDADGTPRIIEVGARLGATCLPELVSHATGVDWVAESLRAALGEPVNVAHPVVHPCAALILEAPADGVLEAISGDEQWRAHPHVLEIEVTARPGDEIRMLRKGTDRIGKVVTSGASAEEAEQLALRVRKGIRFSVHSPPDPT